MRFYNIVISPGEQSQTAFLPITYSSMVIPGIVPTGLDNTSALRVDLDIFQTWYHQPAQIGTVRIYGVSFQDLNQSANFNGAKIQISVGMSAGLPFADQFQAGLIIDGTILQAFGNWQGTQVVLNLQVAPSTYNPSSNVNIILDWKVGQPLQTAVESALSIAYPSVPVYGEFSPNLVYTENVTGYYPNLESFCKWVNDTSKNIIKLPNYLGASVANSSIGFVLTDGTTPATESAVVNYWDLVGNITWIDLATVQAKLVMRADLNIGNSIIFPIGSPITNTVASFSQYRNLVSFDGVFTITQIRHVGNSRQPDANSWVTIVDCVIPGVPLTLDNL